MLAGKDFFNWFPSAELARPSGNFIPLYHYLTRIWLLGASFASFISTHTAKVYFYPYCSVHTWQTFWCSSIVCNKQTCNIGSNFDQELPVAYSNWKYGMAKMFRLCNLLDEMGLDGWVKFVNVPNHDYDDDDKVKLDQPRLVKTHIKSKNLWGVESILKSIQGFERYRIVPFIWIGRLCSV